MAEPPPLPRDRSVRHETEYRIYHLGDARSSDPIGGTGQSPDSPTRQRRAGSGHTPNATQNGLTARFLVTAGRPLATQCKRDSTTAGG